MAEKDKEQEWLDQDKNNTPQGEQAEGPVQETDGQELEDDCVEEESKEVTPGEEADTDSDNAEEAEEAEVEVIEETGGLVDADETSDGNGQSGHREIETKKIFEVLLKSLEIDGQWFRRNLGLFFVITLGLLLFVTNRYQADQEIIEEDLLKDTLEDIRYKALTKFADLTQKKRPTNILTLLRQRGDSTLKAPTDAPYIIKQPSTSQDIKPNGTQAEETTGQSH